MVRIGKSAGIVEMCVGTSKLFRTFIHHVHEIFFTSGYVFRYLPGDAIG